MKKQWKHVLLWLVDLEKVNEKLQEYVTYYNTVRPHTSPFS
ncbi:MAG: transposase [Candidatus Lloydbacteria bacterium]|nr:transposase [Candidatus Lloydbacteria bacterium]